MAHVHLRRLAPRLRRQFGVLTVRQAGLDGVDRHAVRLLRKQKLLLPCQLSVYRAAFVPEVWELRAYAAQLAAGEAAALATWSAARLHGFVRPSEHTEIDLVQPRGTHVRDVAPRPRRSARLGSDDIVEVGGFRCTSVPWTLAELARVARATTAANVLTRAVAEGRVTEEELDAIAGRFHHVPGVPDLRRLLGDVSEVVVGTRSRGEARLRRLLVAAGLPAPVANLEVVDASGRRRFLDLAWPKYGVAIELDLHPSHGTTLGRRADGRRQNDLVHAWVVLRYDEADLVHAQADIVRQVRTTLTRAGWRPTDA